MSASRSRVVLVVDDNLDDRAAVRRLLEKLGRGHIVLEADSGQAGLALANPDRVDCVLLDFYLGDMDGHEFLERLTGEQATPPVPIVMLSGNESDEAASRALHRGAQDYIAKATLTGPGLARSIENAVEKFSIQSDLVQSRLELEQRNRKLEELRDQLRVKVDELTAATHARDQFMAVMSHEMRTPLNAIIGYADLLDMELDGELTDGQRQQLSRIHVGSRHLLDLINDVLDLARADAQKLEIDVRPVDLLAVIEEVTTLLEGQAEAKGLDLIVEPCADGLPHVTADLNRLRQIMTNLVGNAIKFTEHGSVAVRVRHERAEVHVDVIDTGIGIDPEVLPLVFSEFFQANGELTRVKGGSGLGLAIAQRLAVLMGGDIDARSVPGEGSVFTLTLRTADSGSELRTEDVARHQVRMELQSAAAPRRARPVPVVAFGLDGDALAELARRVQPGVRLTWTTDPDALARLTVAESATLVVLDMASADGLAWEAAESLQNVEELATTAILLLPTIPSSSSDGLSDGLDLGWLTLVPKPFTAAQLTTAVSTAARGLEGGEGGDDTAGHDVLVVDDDPDSRRVAAKFLTEARLRVREAADGESALTAMRRRPPDVVVLDLMMPVLDGFGVLATMRADAALAAIPVVVLTAKSLTEAERQFLARTTVRVLQKGEHRLADVAALVLRAAARTGQGTPDDTPGLAVGPEP